MKFRGAETHARSFLKAASWRTVGTIDTFAISWFMTGKVEIAGSIAGLELRDENRLVLPARKDLGRDRLGTAQT